MIFYPAISRKIARKRLMSIMMAVSAFGYAVMLVALAYQYGHAREKIDGDDFFDNANGYD